MTHNFHMEYIFFFMVGKQGQETKMVDEDLRYPRENGGDDWRQ